MKETTPMLPLDLWVFQASFPTSKRSPSSLKIYSSLWARSGKM